MTHLLHEVKDELDWAAREVLEVEQQFAGLETYLKTKISDTSTDAERAAVIAEIEAQKKDLKLNELYAILARASRRFSLLTRVFEIGSQYSDTDAIVTALTDGRMFRLDDTSAETDKIIIEVAEALQNYFHVNFGDDADDRLRAAWLNVEGTLRELGRRI